MDIQYVDLDRSMVGKSVEFLLENDNYLLEQCRRTFAVPPQEARSYFEYTLELAFASKNCSIVAVDMKDGKVVGICTGYITTVSALLGRFAEASRRTELFPSMIDLMVMQHKLVSCAVPLLRDFIDTDVYFGDFSLLRRDLWCTGIASAMAGRSMEAAFDYKQDHRPLTDLGISNSVTGRRDVMNKPLYHLDYCSYDYNGRNPFASLAGQCMCLMGCMLSDFGRETTSKL